MAQGTERVPNILIFGDTGAGKSSVINLIADEKLAQTSSGLLGCTFEHQSYDITVRGVKCRLWDTTGLDEGTEGTVPAPLAQHSLKTLMRDLARTGGINLLIYCIRDGRATKALGRNYHVFYSGICRKKVPVALVVTGLEHWENGMETWWDTHQHILRRHGMQFDEHACVTTLDLEDPVVQERRVESQRRLCDLIITYSKQSPWNFDESFMSQVLPMFRSLIRATPSSGKDPSRKVIVCDMVAAPIQFLPGITSSSPSRRCSGFIGDRQYEFIYIDNSLPCTLPDIGGLLVFYTSPLVDGGIPQEEVDKLKSFYDIAGGRTSESQMIVVLRGCYDDVTSRTRWNSVASSLRDISAHPFFLPVAGDHRAGGITELMEMVERLWINPVPFMSSDLRRSSFFETLLSPILGLIRSKQKSSGGL